MTEFCDFVPDDPSCQPDPVDPVGPSGSDGSNGDDMMDDDMMFDESMEMAMHRAQWAYVMVPFSVLAYNVAYEFRYSDTADY